MYILVYNTCTSMHSLVSNMQARHLVFCRQWDGYPLGLGLVVEDKPTDFSCTVKPLFIREMRTSPLIRTPSVVLATQRLVEKYP